MACKPREDLGDFSWDKHILSKKKHIPKTQISDLRESIDINEEE